MPREISSIKPEIKKRGKDEAIIAVRTKLREPEEINFHYDTSEFDTYAKEGFNPPLSNERFDVREREFLKRVNLDYGKIKIKILSMVRQKAVDPSTGERMERKEYLTFTSEWYEYDYFGAEIKTGTHTEGQYKK
jgi:hypothetical protein